VSAMRNALVLGSTGCIGNNIVRACLEAGWEVCAFRRASSETWTLDGLDVSHAVGDLSDYPSLVTAMIGCDVVFHAAAYYPRHSLDMRASLREAVGGMRAVLRAAKETGVERLVYTSTLTTVGPPGEARLLADERDHYLPGSTNSAYFECKWAMEAEAWRAAAEGLPIVIVNPTAVFGPWDSKPSTGQILLAVARGRFPVWLDLEVNVVDSRDVARGQVLAAECGRIGQRYLLGGENLAVRDALGLAARIAGVKSARWRAPLGLVRAAVAVGEAIGRLPLLEPLPLEHFKTLQDWRPMNIEKAQKELGYTSRPFAHTVQDTIAWFREYGYLAQGSVVSS
jgi:dihydroflavonol-4-reductase